MFRSFDRTRNRRQEYLEFVMPANAGIQVRFNFEIESRLDSGFRRNDSNKTRVSVDQFIEAGVI